MEKAPTFFGKTPTFFKKSPTFFLERRRYYPNLKRVTSGGEVMAYGGKYHGEYWYQRGDDTDF